MEVTDTIFISYAHADNENGFVTRFAERLDAALVAYGVQTWMDKELSGGDKWHRKINRQIDSARAVVLLLSQQSGNSSQVMREMERAISRKLILVIPLVSDIDTLLKTAVGDLFRDDQIAVKPPIDIAATEVQDLDGAVKQIIASLLQHQLIGDDVQINERYRFRRSKDAISSSAAGGVFAAIDSQGGARVAIKEVLSGDDVLHELDEKARRLRQLADVGLPTFIDYIEDRPGKRRWLVNEFIPGDTLHKQLENRKREPFASDDVIKWAGQALETLAYLHRHNVFHHGIKPQNLKYRSNQIKLLDLGFDLRPQDNAPPDPYLAPEQRTNEQADARADIYGLGATLYTLLTGDPNPTSEAPPAYQRNNAVPEALSAVLAKAMQPVPARRYQSAREMLQALQAPVAVPVVVEKRVLDRRLLWLLPLVALLFAVGGWVARPIPPSDNQTLQATIVAQQTTVAAQVAQIATQQAAPPQVIKETVVASPAPTQPAELLASKTLKDVIERGELNCGIAGDLPGFSTPLGNLGDYDGFDARFCKGLAAAIFGEATNHVHYEPLTATVRFNALEAQKVDVLFRNTTFTAGRNTAGLLASGPVIFHDSQALLINTARVPNWTATTSSAIALQQLNGQRICVGDGTTNVINLKSEIAKRFNGNTNQPQPAIFSTVTLAFDQYKAGIECSAFTSTKSQVITRQAGAGLLNTVHQLFDLGSGDDIYREPLAPMYRADDLLWGRVVDYVVYTIIYADELGVTEDNIDDIIAGTHNLSKDERVRALLGIAALAPGQVSIGASLCLRPDFAANILRAVGNYNEIYEATLGQIGSLKQRGPNKVWNRPESDGSRGGILSAPTFQMVDDNFPGVAPVNCPKLP